MKDKLQFFRIEKNDFQEVFRTHFQPLFHLSLNYLEDEVEAKSVVQDAFIKLWEIRNKLNVDSNLRNFLYTLVKHSCLNILKRRQILLKHHEKIRSMELKHQYESLQSAGEDLLEFNELNDRLDKAIKNLPEQRRVIFEMSRFEDLKNREIADKLNVSVKTVEAHLTKALRILCAEFKDLLPLIVFFILH